MTATKPLRTYVRLLGCAGGFTAEVSISAAGELHLVAATDEWTLRALALRADAVDRAVSA